MQPPPNESGKLMNRRFNWKCLAGLAVSVGLMLIPGTAYAANACGMTPSFTYTPVAKAGGQVTLSINAAPDCQWRIVSRVAWIKILSPNSGSGDGAVILRVLPNPTNYIRRGTVGAPTVCDDATFIRSSTACASRFTITIDENGV